MGNSVVAGGGRFQAEAGRVPCDLPGLFLGLRIQACPVWALDNFLSRFPVHVGVLPAGLTVPPTGHMWFALATGGLSKVQPVGNRLGVA